jgi:hypothetical protein
MGYVAIRGGRVFSGRARPWRSARVRNDKAQLL